MNLTEEVNGELLQSREQWEWLQTALTTRGYALVAGSGTYNANVAIAYDKKAVNYLGKTTLFVPTQIDAGGGCEATGLPSPVVLGFRAGELTFTVVGMQFIARDADTSSARGTCQDTIREEQATRLAEEIDRRLDETDGHAFIAGDFNAKANDKSIKPLRPQAGFGELTKKGQRAKGAGKVSWLTPPPLLSDLVMYRKRASKKVWVRKSTQIFDPATAGATYADYAVDFSDHVPVLTSFYTDKP